MPALSVSSEAKLSTCHADLQRLVREVARHFDISVLVGFRTEKEQEAAFAAGTSKQQWPSSPHNKLPALAVDIAPYPIDWEDLRRFYYLGGFVVATAQRLGIPLRWGGDWNGNFDIKDQNFNDLPHFELVGVK